MTDLTKPNAMDQATFTSLSAAQIQGIPVSAISALDQTHCQWLTAAQVAALTPQQTAALAHPDWLSPAAVAGFSADQITRLVTSWSFQSAAWFNALTPQAVAALPIAAIQKMSSSAFKGLSAATIHAMTTQQVAAMAHPDWLSPAAVSGFTAQQLAAINLSWSYMTADWLNAVSPQAFAGIPPAGIAQLSSATLQGLSAAAAGAMTPQQAAALGHPELLPPAAAAALTPAAIAAIAPAAWTKVSSAWLNALPPDSFAAIPPSAIANLGATAIRGLPAADFQRMTAAQFAALADTDWVPLSAVGQLRPDQLQLATDWDSASARWLNALSPEAFAAIPAAGINQMSLAALQGLDATHRAIALKGADEIHAGYLYMASKDATLNYDSVLAKLQQMTAGIGSGGLSAAQFDAFNNTLASACSVTGDASYVSSLMSCMLRDGVKVNMSADAFKQSVDKWFLGTNSATATSYVDLSDTPLFVGSIQQAADGLSQGALGDCWLISSLEDLADNSPERLNGLISANGNGTYAVKFFNSSDNSPVFVTVDGKVAGYGAYTTAGGWARLVEEAYVAACSNGLLQANGYTTPWTNQTSQLEGGVPGYALESISGGSYTTYNSGAAAWDAVQAAFDNHTGLVSYASYGKVSTGADGKTNLVSGHAFSVIGVDEVNHKFILRNPWSDDLTFELSPQELDAIAGSGSFTVMQTPAEYGSAYSHFASTDWSTVSAAWINSQTAAMIGAITPQALGQLCAATVHDLSASTLQAMSVQQLASIAHLDQLSASAVGGLSATRLSALGMPWINGLSAGAVAALPVAWLASLSQAQCQALSGAVVGAMTSQQIAALGHPDWLSPAGVSGLTAQQIPFLKTSWSYQSAAWFNALSPQAIAALPIAAVQAMSSTVVGGLSAATIHAMTPQQIGAFAHPDKLSVAAFGGLTAAQVPAITTSWYWMSAAQMNAMSPEAFAEIASTGINQMTSASLQGLDLIHREIALRSADASHASVIRAASSPAPTDWSQVTASGMNALSAQALATLTAADLQKLPASTIQGLSPATVAALSPQQIAALGHPELLSTAAFGVLSAAQTAAISGSWSAMSAAQLNALSATAFAAIPAASINQMNADALQGLDATHRALALQLADAAHAAILNPPPAVVMPADWSQVTAGVMNGLPAQALSTVSLDDLKRIPSSAVQGLSAATVAALSPQQLAALPHLELLPPAAVAALSPAQAAALTVKMDASYSGAWLAALSPQALAAIAPAVLEHVSASAVASLSPAAAAALTPAQIQVLDYASYVSPAAVAALTPVQTPNFLPWEVDRLGLGRLSPAAAAAISPSVIAQLASSTASTLGADTVAALTPQQIAALPHLELLAPAAVAALSPAQAAALTVKMDASYSGAWLAALSPQALAAISPAVLEHVSAEAVASLSPAAAAALTPAQIQVLDYASSLSPAAVAALTPLQTPNFLSWEVDRMGLNTLSPAAAAAISPSVIAGLATSTSSTLSAATARALTPGQIAALPAIDRLSSAALAVLSTPQIDAIAATASWPQLGAAWINALSTTAFSAVPASAVHLLSSSTLSGLDPAHAQAAQQAGTVLSAPVVSVGSVAGSLAPAPGSPIGAATLVQAMAAFSVPPAATTSVPSGTTARSQISLVTAH